MKSLPAWFPRWLAMWCAHYEAGELSHDDAMDLLHDLCGRNDELKAPDPAKPFAFATMADAALIVALRAIDDIAPVFGRHRIASAITPHIIAGKARGHIMIAAYRAADGAVSARQVERIVAEEIAAEAERERHLVAA